MSGLQRQRRLQAHRTEELAERRARGRRARRGERTCEAFAGIGHRQRLRGGADRRVAGAAAQVAGDRVVAGRAFVRGAEQAHDETRRAVAALRARMVDQRLLHRVQRRAVGERLDGRDLAPRQQPDGQQAAVDGAVVRAPLRVGLDQRHRACAAIAVAATFLGAVRAVPLQPAQQRLCGIRAAEFDAAAVEDK